MYTTKPHTNVIQPKLKIGQPNDRYEQEADQVADQVMKMPVLEIPPVQRKCKACEEEELQMKPLKQPTTPILQKQEEEEEMMQMKGYGNEETISSGLESSLQQSKGSGQNLDAFTQSQMSRGIGADFSNVKVHTDSNAIQMNQQLNAKAFTNGSDIYFNQGQYNPQSSEGKHLLAHELTHVVQQSGRKNQINRQSGGASELNKPGTDIGKIGIVYKQDGANFRLKPDGTLKAEKLLPFNETFVVTKEVSGGWYMVVLADGTIGYVAKSRVWTHLPEPNAKLHLVKSGETAQSIARDYFGAHAKNWGMDERYFVNVLVHVNKGAGDPSKRDLQA